MTEKKIDATVGEKKTLSVDEFDALLEAYKASNPEKYAVKKANGEFDKFRALLEPEKPKGKK